MQGQRLLRYDRLVEENARRSRATDLVGEIPRELRGDDDPETPDVSAEVLEIFERFPPLRAELHQMKLSAVRVHPSQVRTASTTEKSGTRPAQPKPTTSTAAKLAWRT